MMRKLSEEDCRACMRDGDFPKAVRSAAPKVAVILTQGWCPQWIRMRGYLEGAALPPDCAVFAFEYDGTAIFEEFLAFKEGKFGNDQIPYVRYYRSGSLSSTGNYAGEAEFLSKLGAKPQEA